MKCVQTFDRKKFEKLEREIRFQLQGILQLVPVTGSRELEGKVAEGGVDFGDEQ